MSLSSIPEDVQITNQTILDVIAEFEEDYRIDPDNIRLDVAGREGRPWLLVERKPYDGEVWFTMHRSLDEVRWTVAESVWDGPWRPEAVYNTKSGGHHNISIVVEIEE